MATESLSSSAPAKSYIPVTASDTTVFALSRALLVGTAGAATLVDENGAVRVGVPLQAGYNPISACQVYATGLTAANIWRLN